MTLNITHVRVKGGYNRWMTLKLGRCVSVRFLHMCAKFHVSTVKSCRENPDWGGFADFVMIDFSSNFHLSFSRVQVLFLNQHVLNRVSLPADDWRQQSKTQFGRNLQIVNVLVNCLSGLPDDIKKGEVR